MEMFNSLAKIVFNMIKEKAKNKEKTSLKLSDSATNLEKNESPKKDDATNAPSNSNKNQNKSK